MTVQQSIIVGALIVGASIIGMPGAQPSDKFIRRMRLKPTTASYRPRDARHNERCNKKKTGRPI
jgi:hypothetical protein